MPRPSVLFLLLLASAAAAAAQAPATPAPVPRTISVVGIGEAAAAPDLAVLQLAVETEAPEAAQAAARNAELAERVLAAVRAQLGDRGKASTAGYSLYPVYEDPTPERPADTPAIRGYRASNQVRVEVRALDRVGRVVDAGIAAGANRVDGLQFELEAREPHVREALARAGKAARAEAEAAAAALGVRLGPVLAASTAGAVPPPVPMPRMAEMAMRAGQASTPVEPGEVTVRAELHVTYGIE